MKLTGWTRWELDETPEEDVTTRLMLENAKPDKAIRGMGPAISDWRQNQKRPPSNIPMEVLEHA